MKTQIKKSEGLENLVKGADAPEENTHIEVVESSFEDLMRKYEIFLEEDDRWEEEGLSCLEELISEKLTPSEINSFTIFCGLRLRLIHTT